MVDFRKKNLFCLYNSVLIRFDDLGVTKSSLHHATLEKLLLLTSCHLETRLFSFEIFTQRSLFLGSVFAFGILTMFDRTSYLSISGFDYCRFFKVLSYVWISIQVFSRGECVNIKLNSNLAKTFSGWWNFIFNSFYMSQLWTSFIITV